MNKKNKIREQQNLNMKPAVIENIIAWIVIFTSFATIFFFILNYSSVIRMKDNIDALTDYGANYVATNGIGDDISNTLNNIAPIGIDPIDGDTGGICLGVDDNTFQVIFITTSTNPSYKFHNGTINSTRVVFNQVNSNTVTCRLSVTLN